MQQEALELLEGVPNLSSLYSLPLYSYLPESRTQPCPSARFHPAFLNADPSTALATVPAVVLLGMPSLPNQKGLIFSVRTSRAKCTIVSAYSPMGIGYCCPCTVVTWQLATSLCISLSCGTSRRWKAKATIYC